eukprot:scaffold18289_cov17-Prasinocladus_malaysianus.AAC.1
MVQGQCEHASRSDKGTRTTKELYEFCELFGLAKRLFGAADPPMKLYMIHTTSQAVICQLLVSVRLWWCPMLYILNTLNTDSRLKPCLAQEQTSTRMVASLMCTARA